MGRGKEEGERERATHRGEERWGKERQRVIGEREEKRRREEGKRGSGPLGRSAFLGSEDGVLGFDGFTLWWI